MDPHAQASSFQGPLSAIETLRAAKIDACSLANNHTVDFEERGLLDTLEHLDAAGIRHAGAGRNREEAATPAFLDVPAERRTHRVALLAFTDIEPPFAAGAERPGTNYLPVSLEPEVLGRVEGAVSTVRELGADTVVFSNVPLDGRPRVRRALRSGSPGGGRRRIVGVRYRQRKHLRRRLQC